MSVVCMTAVVCLLLVQRISCGYDCCGCIHYQHISGGCLLPACTFDMGMSAVGVSAAGVDASTTTILAVGVSAFGMSAVGVSAVGVAVVRVITMLASLEKHYIASFRGLAQLFVAFYTSSDKKLGGAWDQDYAMLFCCLSVGSDEGKVYGSLITSAKGSHPESESYTERRKRKRGMRIFSQQSCSKSSLGM